VSVKQQYATEIEAIKNNTPIARGGDTPGKASRTPKRKAKDEMAGEDGSPKKKGRGRPKKDAESKTVVKREEEGIKEEQKDEA
jgi:hypothetical protein